MSHHSFRTAVSVGRLRLLAISLIVVAVSLTFLLQSVYVENLFIPDRGQTKADQAPITVVVLDSSQASEAPFPFLSAFSSSFQKPTWRSRPITAQQQQQRHYHEQQQQGRWRSEAPGVFDIVAHGAVGDAVTDDSDALTAAMHAACGHAVERGVVATVLVPWGGCYAVQPITMQGPCGPGMKLQIDGVLVGPSDPAAYPFPDYTSTYFPYTSGFLSFKNFSGLVISGGGRIEGQGWEFWSAFRNYTLQKTIPIRPFAIRLMHCNNTRVEGISIWNSPMYHLFAYACDGLHVRRYKTNSPSRSPNTDSLKLVGIKNALIEDCFLHGGDDDVSVVAVGELVACNITVRNLEATAGHGISIGSVGWDGNIGCVAKVRVINVTLINLTNGIRIKTWQGGLGVVRDVLYENIHMKNTSKAIMLNQFYCDKHQNWTCGGHVNNVALHNIWYRNISAVVRDKYGIFMHCSDTVPCTGIHLQQVNVQSQYPARVLTPVFENVLVSATDDVWPAPVGSSFDQWGMAFPTSEQAALIQNVSSYCNPCT
ncbi:hypothetical protein CLOM_g14043 [Closterium sp. NIES-68]|nr:hypothetical protein CLOM_g23037 [Closterium sp. NIES-68]GJP55055.1 hypothetical protein CLOM_g14043 [Closterium sp. NIES-68]GJP73320.1 hypothetical protein CLOP_g4051 [Closterium sp. NIES-67]